MEETVAVEDEHRLALAALERLMARLRHGVQLTAVSVCLAVPAVVDGLRDVFFDSNLVLTELNEEDSEDDPELRDQLVCVRAAHAPGPELQDLEYNCKILARSMKRAHPRALPRRERPNSRYDNNLVPLGDVYSHAAANLAAVREDGYTVRWAFRSVAEAIRNGEDTDPLVDTYRALGGTSAVPEDHAPVMAAMAELFALLHTISGFPQFAKSVKSLRPIPRTTSQRSDSRMIGRANSSRSQHVPPKGKKTPWTRQTV
ncbi:hypothetical protein OG413_28130 [Streptomyces sp. NBC_01433]|uniref:hypothetical protein n=1 Tax=Streptomyces sp. NBC_01433 TaxID=2903864 RepID=UPI0022515108|nr:hypothetical protein [Streptomyces sp. NBC_01433]MCX4679127.1 hypothetical protein [Streptomyces sp. NBC_01433]